MSDLKPLPESRDARETREHLERMRTYDMPTDSYAKSLWGHAQRPVGKKLVIVRNPC